MKESAGKGIASRSPEETVPCRICVNCGTSTSSCWIKVRDIEKCADQLYCGACWKLIEEDLI